jgi:hypothetical protein
MKTSLTLVLSAAAERRRRSVFSDTAANIRSVKRQEIEKNAELKT